MKKFLVLTAFASALAANAVVITPETTPEQINAKTETTTEINTEEAKIDDTNQQYNFVQCVGTRVLLRKGPGKNYAYYKDRKGRPMYANDPDEFEYLGVTKNNYHKIRIYFTSTSYGVAWISGLYSYRY